MYVGVALLGVVVALCAHCVCVLGEFGGMLPQESLGLLDILRAFLVHWEEVKTRQLNIWLENRTMVSMMESILSLIAMLNLPTLNDSDEVRATCRKK